MYAQPSAPLSIGGVVDDAIRLFRSSFKSCWVFALVLSAMLFGLQIFLIATIPNFGSPKQTPAQVLAAFASPVVIGSYVVVTVLTLVCYGALLTRQSAVARGDESVSVGQAFGTGFRRLPAMLLAAVLWIVAVAVGMIALVIPGLWVSVRLYLWMTAMFVEDAGAVASLQISWRLTKGHWWRAVGILTVTLIIFVVFSVALNFAAGIAAGLAHFGPARAQIMIALLQMVCYTLLYPFITATLLAMYHDFKLRREGGDLAARVGALSSA
jgi:hypothetical protein